MYVIWNDCISIGDVLCSFPGTLALAREQQHSFERVGIIWSNDLVGDLFPHDKYGLERVYDFTKATRRISIHEMVHRGVQHGPQHGHPTAQFMAHVGFPQLSTEALRPEITYGQYDIKLYDVLISPYVLAEIVRFWPLAQWQKVVDFITNRGYKIGCLGSRNIPNDHDLQKINPHKQSHFEENHKRMRLSLDAVDYIFDRPLTHVAYMMSKAKAVITIDSGPGRLMHAVGGSHLLISHNAVAREWVYYPGVKILYANLQALEAADVIPFVAEMLPVLHSFR